MAAGGGPLERVRRLYAPFHDVDDGTWWSALQPGASGFGIVPWVHGNQLSVGDFYWHLQNGVVVPQPMLLMDMGVAFVDWSRGDDDDGLLVRINHIGCYEHEFTSPVMTVDADFRSAVCNCLVSFEPSTNGAAELWAPIWAVTPIDAHYFWNWSEEAEEVWRATDDRSPFPTYEDDDEVIEREALSDWICCGESPQHFGEGHLYEFVRDGRPVCKAIVLSECPCRSSSDVHDCNDEGCPCIERNMFCEGDFAVYEVDEMSCSCGLTDARNGSWSYINAPEKRGLAVARYNVADLVLTSPEVYAQTINYAYDSYFRGWQRCAELAEAENARAESPDYQPNHLEQNWFSSFWQQSAPFSDFSGPARQAATQLPLSTSSAMRQAS